MNVTVAGLVVGLETKSGIVLVAVVMFPVLVVEMLPKDSGVEVMLVDSVTVVIAEVATVTSEVSVVGLDPKVEGKPPLLESYAGGGASKFFPN